MKYEGSKKNHGIVDTKAGGITIREAYGRDLSDVSHSASEERGGSRKMGGGMDNLSHSISGTSANQKGT